MMAKQGSGGRPSVQIKKIQATNATNLKTGSKVTPNVGQQKNPAPGALLPSGSPKRLPTLGTKLK
jgi:hypothetical protein